jgi:hypothetical protein
MFRGRRILTFQHCTDSTPWVSGVLRVVIVTDSY